MRLPRTARFSVKNPLVLASVAALVTLTAGCDRASSSTTTVQEQVRETTTSTRSTTTAPQSPTTTTASPDPAVDYWQFQTHPNGVQLRLNRSQVDGESILLEGAITNGFDRAVTPFRPGRTFAVDDSGEEVVPANLSELESTRIPPGATRRFTLRFEGLARPLVGLVVNEGAESSATAPTTTSPTFELRPLVRRNAEPALPEQIDPFETLEHPSGVSVTVRTIAFGPNGVGVGFDVTNDSGSVVALNDHGVSYLRDDLGNRYPLMAPDPNPRLRLPRRGTFSGVFVFAGRVVPEATAVLLVLNDGPGASPTDPSTTSPSLASEPYAIGEAGSSIVPTSADTDLAARSEGISVSVSQAAFNAEGVELTVLIENEQDRRRVLTAPGHTYLEDDIGGRYPLVPDPTDPQIRLDPGGRRGGTLRFRGAVDPAASHLRLLINRGSDPAPGVPTFDMGPITLQWEEDAADLLVFGERTEFARESPGATELDRVRATLSDFSATVTERGIELTLPEVLLFDFDRFDLRPDATATLSRIAELVGFYAGDPVLIVGHTDSVGSADYNLELSEQRARSVVRSLIQDHGVEPNRLSFEGRGEEEPIASNASAAGRQWNRRVVVIISTERGLPESPNQGSG